VTVIGYFQLHRLMRVYGFRNTSTYRCTYCLHVYYEGQPISTSDVCPAGEKSRAGADREVLPVRWL
jgi:rubredoxin